MSVSGGKWISHDNNVPEYSTIVLLHLIAPTFNHNNHIKTRISQEMTTTRGQIVSHELSSLTNLIPSPSVAQQSQQMNITVSNIPPVIYLL